MKLPGHDGVCVTVRMVCVVCLSSRRVADTSYRSVVESPPPRWLAYAEEERQSGEPRVTLNLALDRRRSSEGSVLERRRPAHSDTRPEDVDFFGEHSWLTS